MKHAVKLIERALRNYWDLPSLSNYNGRSYTYREVAVEIEKRHLLYERCGIKAGDKVTLCARNSAEWGMAFLSVLTYGAVPVPLLNDFTPGGVVNLVRHSDSVLMLTDSAVWNGIEREGLVDELPQMPRLKMVVDVQDGEPLYAAQPAYGEMAENAGRLFARQYPAGMTPADVAYTLPPMEDLALISYTSGTTSSPKGVMISHRSLSSNVEFSIANMPNRPGQTVLSMLPMAHLYGLVCDFIYPFCTGIHIHFLGRTPTPAILLDALARVKPYMLLMVPLVIEKIFRGKILPVTEKPVMRALLMVPGVREVVLGRIREKLLQVFGGGLTCGLVLGGAALSEKVERLLKAMKFPYTVGYGMTECGPLVCFANHRTFRMRSCGRKVSHIDIRIDSPDSRRQPGEICVRGWNVMEGYYKNPEATQQVLDSNGWLRTGDMGVMDAQGNVFIKGRCKNMILGANGQNIYPEEVEDKMNAVPGVAESLVLSRDGKLTALIVPDADYGRGAGAPLDFGEVLKRVNAQLPAYCRLAQYELRDEPFEKTPKKSIRRFLYN